MATRRVLCVFANILGHDAECRRFMEVLNRTQNLEPTYVTLGLEDYVNVKVPWWARATDPWHGQFIARQKARPVIQDQTFDLLLVNAWELAVEFRGLARRMPAGMVLDAVPTTMNEQLRKRGQNGPKRWMAHRIHHQSFVRAVGEFDFFFPKSSVCLEALVRDYGVTREGCYLALPHQHLKSWKPGDRQYTSPARLLFVGNDFARKGGQFLLHLYSEHLSDKCTLTIASNDPHLAGRQLPPGVTVLTGKSQGQLLQVYRDSDIFVFPTQQDFTPEVLGEAVAIGLPSIVTDVDGARDLIQDEVTGFVMDRRADTDAWAKKIHLLLDDPGKLTLMSQLTRRFAETHLSFERFETLVRGVIEGHLGQPVAAAGAAAENRQSVAAEFTAAVDKDRGQADPARAVLLDDAGGEASGQTAARSDSAKDRCPPGAGGLDKGDGRSEIRRPPSPW